MHHERAKFLKPGEKTDWSVERVRRVPDKYKFFLCDTHTAAVRYSIKGPLLEELLDLGMPHIGRGGQIFFDDLDLANISLDLQLNSTYCATQRFWSRSMKRARINANAVYVFKLSCSCPCPGHDGSCRFTIDERIQERIQVKEQSHGVFVIQGSPVSQAYEFGSLIEPMVAAALQLKFHLLPTSLTEDTAFLKESQLANCHSATLHLIEVASKHGVVARTAMGLFISLPQSVRHVWLEILVADEWRHADPFFLSTLIRWGIINERDWPLSRSPDLAVFALSSGQHVHAPIIYHNDEPILGKNVTIWTAQR